MLRPGGFPEYSPAEQKIFDTIRDVIRRSFEQRNFVHIWTPAVEKNEILLKGGESVANEIFGLIGKKEYEEILEDAAEMYIAQEAIDQEYDGSEEKEDLLKTQLNKMYLALERIKTKVQKDYSLHFDLTVPFARYALDHVQELVFPFKRYQMQPVWRGERQQRGRFKEFWQCDVDCIWRSGTEVGHWYACETIATLQSALRAIFKHFSLDKSFASHVSHVGLTKKFISAHARDAEHMSAIVDLLDRYYKKEHAVFVQELTELAGSELADKILHLIQTKDPVLLAEYDADAFAFLTKTLETLRQLGTDIHYDVTIVRGLGYYTDIVFETFVDNEMSLGSVCSGGGYQDFTKFIDPKQVFSGIGGSIGLSRLMEILFALVDKTATQSESYFFLNFESTQNDILGLYTTFLSEGKVCELYPVAAKFGKQLEYADKKGMTYAVILGDGEKEKNSYIVKNMKTGEQVVCEM